MHEGAARGYVDEHVHLLSAAAARRSVDVSVETAPDLASVLTRIRAAPAVRGFVRAWGLDDALVAERRAPTREELDRAVPDRPLVIHHRSGHEEYRNTLALGYQPPRLDLADALRDLAGALQSEGIVAVTDATPNNGEDEIRFFVSLQLPLAVTLMVGADRLPAHHPYGWTAGGVQIGHAKVMARAEEIAPLVVEAHRRGWPVAVHVDEIDVLEATLEVVERSVPPAGTFDRIEHLALSLPEHVDRIAALADRLAVVTQPSFLLHRGTKYREQLSEVEQTWLYRVRSLVDRGVPVAFSSDTPIVPARPAEWIECAVDRAGFDRGEAVDRATAERLACGLGPAGAYRAG